jgi:DNA-directed RNA polymerase subunit RPC12/RpoP
VVRPASTGADEACVDVLRAAATTYDCLNCRDARYIEHPLLGHIRCPRCTTRKRKIDRSGLDQISKDEAARREQQQIDAGEPTRYTGLAWTVDQLYQWGKFVRDHGIGYPPMAATEKARIGRGGSGYHWNTPFPPDLEAIDRAVAIAPVDYKTVLVEHYSKFGFANEKAARLGISRQTYYQRKASAERYIATAIGV